ncbi:MAG TPA: GldG family protein [bacterium]|nr:GldG family protein [bacterium]
MKSPGILAQVRAHNLPVLVGGIVLAGLGVVGVLVFNTATWWALALIVLGLVALGFFLAANLSNVKEVGRKRSTQVRANLSLVAAAMLAIVVTVNYIVSRHPVRFDLTANHMYTLAPETLDALKGLTQDVNVTLLMSGKRALPAVGQAQALLQEYAKYSGKFHFKVVDVDKNPSEAKRLGIHEYNTVVFESGDNRKDVLQRDYITYAFTGQQPTPKFQGESAFTSALASMKDSVHSVVYFTTGHGERDRNNPQGDGLNTFQEMLQKENYDVKDLNLLAAGKIPEDATVIAIAGPSRAFQPTEVAALRAFVKNGGKVLAMLDPWVNSGLDPLLRDFGVKTENDVVIDPTSFAFPDVRSVIPVYGAHAIVSKLADQRLASILPFARGLEKTDPGMKGATSTVLLQSTDKGFGDTVEKDKYFKFHKGQDLKGPIPMAIASEWPLSDKPGVTARLVVFGSSLFVINQMVQAPGNIDLGLNSFSWLVGDDKKITIRPKEDDNRTLNLSNTGVSIIYYLTVVLMPLGVIGAGILIWWRRRSL